MAISKSSSPRVIGINDRNGFRLELHGYSQTLKNLQLTKDQTVRLQKFLQDEANKVVQIAKAIVPIDEGRLRDSHRVLTYGATGKYVVRADVIVGGIVVRGRFVDYAAAVHEGSRAHGNWPAQPPRPWLAAALKMHEPGYVNRLKKVIKIGR